MHRSSHERKRRMVLEWCERILYRALLRRWLGNRSSRIVDETASGNAHTIRAGMLGKWTEWRRHLMTVPWLIRSYSCINEVRTSEKNSSALYEIILIPIDENLNSHWKNRTHKVEILEFIPIISLCTWLLLTGIIPLLRDPQNNRLQADERRCPFVRTIKHAGE